MPIYDSVSATPDDITSRSDLPPPIQEREIQLIQKPGHISNEKRDIQLIQKPGHVTDNKREIQFIQKPGHVTDNKREIQLIQKPGHVSNEKREIQLIQKPGHVTNGRREALTDVPKVDEPIHVSPGGEDCIVGDTVAYNGRFKPCQLVGKREPSSHLDPGHHHTTE
jgi:hypothetical protein